MNDVIPITVEKAKVGPITERYQNGEFNYVEPTDDNGVKRMAVIGLDNSHNSDYRVGYASDPVIVIQTPNESTTHDQLKSILKANALWIDGLTPIEIPTGESEWKAGFKSLPRDSHLLDAFKAEMKSHVERDLDYLEGKDGATAYLSE